MGLSLQNPLKYADAGEDMLMSIVTWDESWVHHYQTEIKVCFSGMETSRFTFNPKFKVILSAGKVVRTIFFYFQGVL
jgi:hypothetical protein